MICETHGRLRCSECAYIEELRWDVDRYKSQAKFWNEEAQRRHAWYWEQKNQVEELRKALEYIADIDNCFENLPEYARKALGKEQTT